MIDQILIDIKMCELILAEGKNSKVTIKGRRIKKINHGGKRDSTTVSGMVEIFKNLRYRRFTQ